MSTRNCSLSLPPVHRSTIGSGDIRQGPRLDLSGPVLGARYRLLGRLGRPGPLTVHAAEDITSGRRLAIRLLCEPDYGVMAQRYHVEVRAALNLAHPNIVDVIDFGRDILGEGEPVAYLVTEYLAGENLAATLERSGPLGWVEVVAIGKQVCAGLTALNEQYIVHGDIGPRTCFRVLRGRDRGRIKLLDFGSAGFACKRTGRCSAEPRVAERGDAAPELLAGGSYDHRVDIYAVGLLMYRLLTGRSPFVGDGETPLAIAAAAPGVVVPPGLEAVIVQALARRPEARQPDAQALCDALVGVERTAIRASRLDRDPLEWGPFDSAKPAHLASASDSALECAEFLDPDASVRSTRLPSWRGLVGRASLAFMVATIVVRTTLTWLS